MSAPDVRVAAASSKRARVDRLVAIEISWAFVSGYRDTRERRVNACRPDPSTNADIPAGRCFADLGCAAVNRVWSALSLTILPLSLARREKSAAARGTNDASR